MKEQLEHAIRSYTAPPATDEYDRRMPKIKASHSELEAGDLAIDDPKRRTFLRDSLLSLTSSPEKKKAAAAAEGAHRDDHHVSYDIDVITHRPLSSESVHATSAIGQLKNDSYFDPKPGSRKTDARRAVSKTVDKLKRDDDSSWSRSLRNERARVTGMLRRTYNSEEIRRQFGAI